MYRKTNIYECWCGHPIFVELAEDSSSRAWTLARETALFKHQMIHKFQPNGSWNKKNKSPKDGEK